MNRYPLWKYIVLIMFVLFGILYALPNFFGEDPVLQITGSEGVKVSAPIMESAQQTLQADKIPFKSMKITDNGLLVVRFNHVADQIKAKDDLTVKLGDSFIIAQNLLSVTPTWLTAIGAEPMKWGLDLRGGMHFLLQVDVDSVIAARAKSDMRSVADTLRQNNLRYAGIRPDASGLFVLFRDATVRDSAQQLLQRTYPDYMISPMTINGATNGAINGAQNGDMYLRFVISPVGVADLRDYTMTQTITVLRNRIDALGVAEPSISRQGLDRIVVELPGIQDMALAKEMLGGTATLEFHLVDAEHDVQSALAGMVPLGTKIYYMADGAPILLKSPIMLSGNAITYAAASFDQFGQPSVGLRISGPEVVTFNDATSNNVGQRMGIVYVETKNTPKLMNGKIVNVARKVEHVISAPVIQSALGNNFQITGLSSVQESKNLSIQLKSGALPANIYSIQERNVGPSLGAENIYRGVVSVLAGFMLIVLFMVLYYRKMGLIADVALLMNVVFIVALMSVIGITLTLPGIAGIVLTMGIAVDANVLIFERIREEIRLGATVQAAIHAGYERAFSTIIDANVSALIVAIALVSFGSGPVQAFAITLIIGVLTSMVTAIMGTRALVNLIFGNQPLKKLSIGI